MKEKDMKKIAIWMNRVIEEVSNLTLPEDKEERREVWKKHKAVIMENKNLIKISKEVKTFCIKYPLFAK
jgi:glycine/serine hydroxymethyltransferase